MNRDEVKQLLSVITTYDNRPPDEAAVMAWTEASERGGWTYPEALDAIHDHFGNTTVWLMPGHITQAIKEVRERSEPYPRRYNPETDDDRHDVASVERIREIVGQAYKDHGWKQRAEGEDDWKDETCEWCDARPGQQCRRPHSGQPMLHGPHPCRIDAAKERRKAKAKAEAKA